MLIMKDVKSLLFSGIVSYKNRDNVISKLQKNYKNVTSILRACLKQISSFLYSGGIDKYRLILYLVKLNGLF